MESRDTATEFGSQRQQFLAIGLLVLACLLSFLPGLGMRDLWFPDEPDVAEPAISMYRSGDWTVPRHNDEPWADYPPMTYWLGATSAKLVGEASPLALRLPIAWMATSLVALTAWVTMRRRGLWPGVFAGAVLSTSSQFVLQATNFHPDMAFALFIAGGVMAYARGAGCARQLPSWAWRVFGFALLGAAVLSKGPLGLLLPGLVLGLWHLSMRQWRRIAEMVPLTLVALATSLPWYAAFAEAIGAGTVWEELYRQNFARFVAGARGHEQTFVYFFVNIWHNLFPWAFLLPFAMLHAFRKQRNDPAHRLAAISFVVSFLFLSVATTKREVYLLPAYPAIAFLVGSYLPEALTRLGRAWRWWAIATGGLLATLGLVLPWVAQRFGEVSLGTEGMAARGPTLAERLDGPVLFLQLVMMVAGVAIVWANRDRLTHGGVLTLAGGLMAFYLTLNVCILPPLNAVNSYASAGRWLREIGGAERIGYYLPSAHMKPCGFRVSDPAYLPLQIFDEPAEVAAYLSTPSRVVVLHADEIDNLTEAFPTLEDYPRRRLELGSNGFYVLGHGVTQ